MDHVEYTSLAAAMGAVPDPRDPRDPRGRRYPWSMLLLLISAALVSGQPHGRAISQWVHEHEGSLRAALGWTGPRWPSASTLRRAVRHLDVAALEARLRHLQRPPSAAVPTGATTPTPLVGQALDGKGVRGAGSHGQPVHLVALVRHAGVVLDQAAVADKANEIVAAPQLLRGRDLRGTVTTMDALLTQRSLATQIRRQGGHYLMVVKDNQPDLEAAITTLFADPPWLAHERAAEYAVWQTLDKGHGRLETRTLEASPSLNDWLDWPGVGQVLRRTCRRVLLRTGEVQEAVRVAITSVPFSCGPAAVEHIWRGHWAIENRVHHVRDVTFREDAGQAHCGATAQALAALRNAILTLLRAAGWTNLADATRHYAADPRRALALVGVPVLRL